MATKDEFGIRAQRWLSGELNSSDIEKLFLFLRARSHGSSVIKDIGDVLGHSDRRTKGVMIDRVWDLYQIWRYHLPRMDMADKGIDLMNAPANMLDLLRISLNSIDEGDLFERTGYDKRQAKTRIGKMPNKFSSNLDRSLRFTGRDLTDRDIKLIEALLSLINVRAIYTEAELTKDLSRVLLKEHLIDDHQVEQFESIAYFASIVAVANLHGTLLIMPDGSEVKVTTGFESSTREPVLNVHFSLELEYKTEPRTMSASLFHTGIAAENAIEGFPDYPARGYFTVPIEINRAGKITPLS